MPAGRPKKPKELHEAEGTFRADRHLEEQFMPSLLEFAPSAPTFLSTRAKMLWNDLCMEFADKKMLYRVDLGTLAQLCHETDQYWLCVEHINHYGPMQTMYTKSGDSYETLSPWVRYKDSAFSNANKLGMQFGLTPVARTRILSNPIDKPGSLAALLHSDDDDD
jgi:P27 family predicted phage terminase small subunit